MDYNYTILNYKNQINYPPDTKLVDALKRLKQRDFETNVNHVKEEDSSIDIFLDNVSKNKEVSEIKVNKYLNRGSSALVFETPEGDILKLTSGNHFPMNRPHADFDVPIFKKGKCGKIFYYIEEKLYQHGITEGFVEIIKDKIKAEGYRVSDLFTYDVHQVGLSGSGKLYLLDPECAKYKTIFHAIYDKLKRMILK